MLLHSNTFISRLENSLGRNKFNKNITDKNG